MDSIFTKIIKGEIPCYKISENDKFFAFLDIRPNAKGHSLVVPKKQIDKLFDLDAETYLELFEYAQKVARALKKVVPCKRIGLSVIGLEVPHVHVHLIPLNSMDDINFSKKVSMEPREFSELSAKIAKEMNS